MGCLSSKEQATDAARAAATSTKQGLAGVEKQVDKVIAATEKKEEGVEEVKESSTNDQSEEVEDVKESSTNDESKVEGAAESNPKDESKEVNSDDHEQAENEKDNLEEPKDVEKVKSTPKKSKKGTKSQ